MAGKFCQTCISWERIAERISGDIFGMCKNVSVSMNVALDGQTKLSEEGTLWTCEYYGCIYWRNNPAALIDTSKIVKDIL